MSECNTCAIKNTQRDDASEARISRLRRCEPFCDNGCGPSQQKTEQTPPIYTFLRDLGEARLQRAGFRVCRDAKGKLGVQPVDATGKTCGPCIPLECKDPCAEFGPHANAARRRGDLSPTDIRAIISAYSGETLTLTGGGIIPGQTQAPWYYLFGSPGLGLSHRFCVKNVAATITPAGGGDGVPTPVTDVRIAGGRIACSGLASRQGSYEWVIDYSKGVLPSEIEVTPARCVCKNLCAYTPEQGWEFFMVELPDVAPADIDLVTLNVYVERDDWMVLVDECVSPQGNRFTYDTAPFSFNPTFSRVEAGAVKFIP